MSPACWTSDGEAPSIIAQVNLRDFAFSLTHNHFYDPSRWRPTTTEGWCIWDALEVLRCDWMVRHPNAKAKPLGLVIAEAVGQQIEGMAA